LREGIKDAEHIFESITSEDIQREDQKQAKETFDMINNILKQDRADW
jgi:hypothetical protein